MTKLLSLTIALLCLAAIKSPREASKADNANAPMSKVPASITPPKVAPEPEIANEAFRAAMVPPPLPLTNLVWSIQIPAGSVCILEYCTNLSISTGHTPAGVAVPLSWPQWVYLATIGATDSNQTLQVNVDISKPGIAPQHFFRSRVRAGN